MFSPPTARMSDVPLPPADQDLVEYFLFDLRKGYCDYYASAMVVLARAAGIPARMAVGYASGAYDLNSRRFQVTQAVLGRFSEAIEHAGPGIYDEAYLDYLYAIIKKAGEYNIEVFLDPHQDACRAR